MSYVDFKVPDELKEKASAFLKSVVEKRGKVKKGMNECTKAIERGIAKFVVIADDISPAEIVMHIPKIAQEKKIPYMFIGSKADLGKVMNIKVECSALAVIDLPKELDGELKEIVNNIAQLKE